MEKKVLILSIKKNEIIQQKRKIKRNYLFNLSFIFICLFTLLFSSSNSIFSNIKSNMVQIYNPVNSLYSDNSDIVFTNSNALNKDTLNFIVPIKGSNIEVDSNGTIVMNVVSYIIVTSIESGIVEETGITNDGIKYIKIRHNANVYSLIENVDIIGINKLDTVKSGQDIATAKVGDKVYLQIFKDDNKITNLKIDQNKIIWES